MHKNLPGMKGIVFTEFLEMVEEKFGFEIADQIVNPDQLSTQGVFTAVGTYPFSDMIHLLTNLSQATRITPPELLRVYGNHLFGRFAVLYAPMIKEMTGTMDLLEKLDRVIHVEVKKLYPDAELPRFITEELTEDTISVIYQSERGLADFAQGLLEASIAHFNESIAFTRENLTPDMKKVRFTLVKS